eukprot:jgi/Ulvmu1/4641/UM002_0372.1
MSPQATSESTQNRVNAAVVDLQRQKSRTLGGQIPKFYFQRPVPSSIASHLYQACRERAQGSILTPDALNKIRVAICRVCEWRDGAPAAPLEQAYLTIRDIHQVRSDIQTELGHRFSEFLSAAAILRHHFQDGRLSGKTLFNTIVMANERLKLIEVLRSKDDDGDACLTEGQLTEALTAIAVQKELPVPDDLIPLWQIFATRRLAFPYSKRGLVPILKIAQEPAMHLLATYSARGTSDVEWFSFQKLQDVKNKFVELDEDGDGHLTPDELARVRPGALGLSSMVPYFVQRVFEQHVQGCAPQTKQPGMSMTEFVDFLMAWNHRGQQHATKYFFKVLDVENRGYLTARVIEMWCVHVHDLAVDRFGWVGDYNPLDTKDEVFDMVKPKRSDRITLQDMIHQNGNEHRAADTCGLMVDAACLMEYEQRESM